MLKKSHGTEKNQKVIKVIPYSLVADIYSNLMDEVNYKRWARYIYFLAKDKIHPGSSILELASGNCRLTEKLLHKNKKIICTDISKQMLMKSTYNRKIVCDMTCLPFNQNFDLIFSTFDSINYLLSRNKLLMLFKEVHRLLKVDGLFTFDVSLEKNSYIHQKDSKKSGRTKNYKYYRKSVYDPTTGIHSNYFKILDNDGNTFTEVHKQKIFKFNEYFELLEKAGLYVVNCFKTFTSKDGTEKSDRVQFIVKRK
jgi:ubiquinone/menaquinone biosynthesis C-methylase UbiE